VDARAHVHVVAVRLVAVLPLARPLSRATAHVDDPDLAALAAFVGGYRAHIPITAAQLADAAHRRWWTLLTEAWPLKRHYDANDRSLDHLFARRSDYLRWWTAHRAEVCSSRS
jgi:homoserine kinase type II